jgi:hypothetical protein
MAGVFISYRREDSPGHAGRIFDCLRTRLGSDVVFMDVHAIEAGVDFGEAIDNAVGSCDALLAVIGPGWVSAAVRDGRRLDDPLDFVRLEIVGALKRDIRVVPVLVDNAEMPIADDLPDELKLLTRRNALVLRDSRWDTDIDELVRIVERLLTSRERDQPAWKPTRLVRGSGTRYGLWGVAAGIVLVFALAIFGPRGGGPGSGEETRDTITDSPPDVVVGRVSPGGPAAIAGILANDVIIEVAGRPVTSFSDVADAVADRARSTPPGTASVVEVVRKGERLSLSVVFDREFVLR